jgi:HSP20 family protein
LRCSRLEEESVMNIKDLRPWSQDKRELLVRREPTDPMLAFQSDINRAFENFWRGFNDAGRLDWRLRDRHPAGRHPREVKVIAELPGMDEADIDVSVAEGALTISGEKKLVREAKEKG